MALRSILVQQERGQELGPRICPACRQGCVWNVGRITHGVLRTWCIFPHMHPGTIYTIMFCRDPTTAETSGCPSRDHVKPPMFALIYSLVLDLPWLETPDDMVAWSSQRETFLLSQSSYPRASLMRLHIGWGTVALPPLSSLVMAVEPPTCSSLKKSSRTQLEELVRVAS